MKKNIVLFISRALLTMLLSCGLAAAGDTSQLQKLKHSVVSPTTEQVVLQLNGSYSPKIFTLKGETPKIIFDFPETTHGREIKSVTTTNGGIVKRVRVGMHADGEQKTRVVFDVATLKGLTHTQKFDEKNGTLTILFTVPEKAAPSQKAQAKPPKEMTGKKQTTVQMSPQAPDKETVAEKEQIVSEPQQPALAATAATTKTEPPPLAEKIDAPAETETATMGSPEKKAEEKPVTSLPAQKTPEKSVEAKSVKKTEAPPIVSEAKPEENLPTTAAVTPVGVQKEEKKIEPAIQEPTREPVAAPPVPDTTQAAQNGSKSTTEAAKNVIAAKTADGPELEYVKFDATSPKGEMVMFKLNGFHPPTVHGVEEGIPRVICDFNNTKLTGSGKNMIKTDGKFVKIIRIMKTRKPEKVRVMIDLEPNHSYDLQQVFFKEDNLFVIIVNTVKK